MTKLKVIAFIALAVMALPLGLVRCGAQQHIQ